MSCDPRFVRTQLLLGEPGFDRLARAHVLILGVGGVGAYAAEAIARAGVGEMTLVDGDTVEISNCNRQLPALNSTLGRAKVAVVAERLADINPDIRLHPSESFITKEKFDELFSARFDFAVDAIDSLQPKCDFIAECLRREIKLVSSMGAGGKLDPAQVRIADLSKTYGCALARAVRGGMRQRDITSGVPCVFSPEPPRPGAVAPADAPGKRPVVGTVSYLPGVFGLFCASQAIRVLTETP